MTQRNIIITVVVLLVLCCCCAAIAIGASYGLSEDGGNFDLGLLPLLVALV